MSDWQEALAAGLDALVTHQDAGAALSAFGRCGGAPDGLRPVVRLNTLLAEFLRDAEDGHRVWGLAKKGLRLVEEFPWYIPAYNLTALMLASDVCVRLHPSASKQAVKTLSKAVDTALHPQTFLLLSSIWLRGNNCAEATAAYAKAITLGAGMPSTEHVVRAYCDTGDGSVFLLHKGAATLLDTLYAADTCDTALLALHSACFAHLPWRERDGGERSGPGGGRIAFVSEHLAPGSVLSNTEPFLRRMSDTLIVDVSGGEDSAFIREMRGAGRVLPAESDALRKAGVGIVVCLDGCTGTLAALEYVSAAAPAGAAVVSAVGYAHPTGHPSVHFRLTDSVADPTDPGEESREERPLRLDPCFLCWQAPTKDAPLRPVADREAFVANHNFKKLSPPTLVLYAAVLEACPGATLTLKPTTPLSPAQRDWIKTNPELRALADAGRVHVEDAVSDQAAYYAFMSRFKVCLDSTPYTGTVTTLEALWSDMPVVTLVGGPHRARVSASILHAIGHTEWCADDAAAYVRIARELWLADREVGEVRGALAGSCIMDHEGYSRRLGECLSSCVGAVDTTRGEAC